jgi:chemotaxis protein methyltransferase WspC
MPHTAIEHFLEKTIGLDVHSVGSTLIRQAYQKRIHALRIDDASYLDLLKNSTDEQKALIDNVVVLETWFFRNHTAFEYLGEYVRHTWLANARGKIMRVLVLPCATGEEAYSAAITLIEHGLSAERFRIDAVDICERALEKARSGHYGASSFRGHIALHFRSLYFDVDSIAPGGTTNDSGYRIHAWLQNTVHFLCGNLLCPDFNVLKPGYDVIFCRNLLIYFTPSARFQAVRHLTKLLDKNGLLFLGHAERSSVCEQGFIQVTKAGAFACRKAEETTAPSLPSATVSSLLGTRTKLPHPPLSAPVKNHPKPTITSDVARFAPIENNVIVAGKAQDLLAQAQILADQGLLQQALRLGEDCLQLKPDSVDANFLVAVIYQALNQDSHAERYFNKTLYLEPKHIDALNHLAFLVEKRGHSENAARLRLRLQRLRERDSV